MPLLKQVASGLLVELEALLSGEVVESLDDAILDSGASQTYVTKRVKLANAVPGTGVVEVATGQLECVLGARRPRTFARSPEGGQFRQGAGQRDGRR